MMQFSNKYGTGLIQLKEKTKEKKVIRGVSKSNKKHIKMNKCFTHLNAHS
jgi:hypothetical protein